MKSLFGILAVVWVTQVSGVAQFFFLTHYDRAGNLQWTNLLCTTAPVYEVLQSQSVTGPWTHLAYVTNSTSYTVSNTVPTGSSAFYKLAWTSDTPVTLDYSFDEGFGFPSVTGNITLNFSSLSATWNFEDTGINESPHPVGPGSGQIAYSSDLRAWFVTLRTAIDDAVYLGGFLQSSGTPSGCEYTVYAGQVFYVNLGGTDQIGDFVATKP